ncbi:MAG: hypothetical protein H6707_03485 [Deltaproteobacteria bacterium]|nr:hypothetical protein [Deltaproteobacteria bacterium]
MKHIPCGLYRTTEAIGESVPAGVLVYFHNHGEPGPGLYLPESWQNNRVCFSQEGICIPDNDYAATLQALATEGFYVVIEPFYCCEQRCQYFEADTLVQLGYNGDAEPILFLPEIIDGALALPAEGTFIDDARLAKLKRLLVAESDEQGPKTLQ